METIEHRINIVITYSGLSVRAFARRCDVSYYSMYSCTTGRRPANLEIVTGIIRAFPELEERWLLLGEGHMLSDRIRAILERKQ